MDLTSVRKWYRRHHRKLPWREGGTTAWAIFVSEVMLQQTPVARVIPAWQAWMERWPQPVDLAKAALADVLRQWNRLGYPRRARNLHRSAQIITQDFDGHVPRRLDDLLGLPGVGDYTARAIACFAYGDPHPLVDTNVKRVVARALDGVAGAGHWGIRHGLERVHEATGPDTPAPDYCLTQRALMELGALVCTARNPRCDQCPLAQQCQWRKAGFPLDHSVLPRTQARYEGSDRQARGVLLAALRDEPAGLERVELLSRWPHRDQALRALESLDADGFIAEQGENELRYRLRH